MKIAITALLVLLGVLLGGALLAGPRLMEGLSGLAPEPPSVEVRTQVVAPTRLVETISAPGIVEPHTKVDIASEVSARIEQLPVDVGNEVRRGDVIARLDDRDLRAALESADARREAEQFRMRAEQARLQGLRTTLEFARRQLERKQTLYESGDISRRELDDALEREQDLISSADATNYNISVIESSLAAAQADIDQAQDALDNTVIVAPMDGTVIAVNMEVGEQVLATFSNIGSIIMTVADLSRMILRAEIAESDIASVHDGQSATLHINAYPDEKFKGTVTEIALQRTVSTDGTGVFETEIEIDLQGRRIRSGLTANVDVEIEAHEGLAVESQAILERVVEELPEAIRRDNLIIDRSRRTTKVVYRLVNNESVCTPVRSGASDLTRTLITEGLSEGDVVITGPYKVLEKIKHGERMKAEGESRNVETSKRRNEQPGEGEETDEDADTDTGTGTETGTDERGDPRADTSSASSLGVLAPLRFMAVILTFRRFDVLTFSS